MNLDLIKIAQIERASEAGKLFAYLDKLFARSDTLPDGSTDAVVWKMGNFGNDVQPITHALTDKFSLVGTLALLDILQLPSHLVPMMAQFRHDTDLASLAWFGNMPGYGVKWSTAGDAMVDDHKGGTCVVQGKSGNAKLRTDAGVYCNVRSIETAPGVWIKNVRAMPMLPYSQQKGEFRVDEQGDVHSTIKTPGVRLAYACRQFLHLVHEQTLADGELALGRAAIKPTQALEDGIMAGLLTHLIGKTNMGVKKQYVVNAYEEHKENIDKILALLPDDFYDGMQIWQGDIYMHIADTNYGLLLHDFIAQKNVVVLSTDLDGDRLTDLMADAPKALMSMMQKTAARFGKETDPVSLWRSLGFHATTGMDMPSIMYRMTGLPIYEMTLGSADEMLNRILDDHELSDADGNKKSPYNPRIHMVLTIQAMKAANPDHTRLHEYLDIALRKFDEVYQPGKIPTFMAGIETLRRELPAWGQRYKKAQAS